MLSEFSWDQRYHVSDIDNVLTPALVVYPEIIDSNIARTLHLLGGNVDRWRPHIKTAKLAYTLRMLVERGCRNLKCATTLELLIACRSGAIVPVIIVQTAELHPCASNLPHKPDNSVSVPLFDSGTIHARIYVEKNADPAILPLLHLFFVLGEDGNADIRERNGLRRRMPAMTVCWNLSTR